MALSKRLISALIAFLMSVTIATTAFAQTDNSITLNEEQNQLQTVEPSQEEKISIEYASIPEQLDVEELKAQGFSTRVKSEETDLSDIVLEKNDGTRALYIFDSPVKYISDDGDVIDKSNKVIKNGSAFNSESNDIEVTLPLSLSSGITVDDEELNLSMRPISNNNLVRVLSVGKKSGEESVKYEGVFDEYTDVEYTYTYDGVKEDIILEKYNGINKFDFELLTNGLELCEDKGVLLLKDNNGNVQAVIGEIVVFSADNKNNTMGKYQIIEKEKNNYYVISVTVDNEYLKSEKTKYPVTIDPSIKSNVDNNGIEDMQVFKGTDGKGDTEKSAGLSGVSRVGWSDWGTCRTLLKFKQKNVLTNHNIKAKGQIISASIEMRDLMCQGDEVPVYCTQFTGKKWSESGQYTWNALNAENTGKGGSMLPVSYANGKKKSDTNPSTDTMSHWFKWNVSNIVKNWVGNTSDIEKGIEFYALPMLEGSSVYASYMKTFGSVQADSKYRPYFYIEYNQLNDFSVAIKSSDGSSPNKIKVDTAKDLDVSISNSSISYTQSWSSSNTSVASITQSGVVTGKKQGKTTITLTVTSSQGYSRKASITAYVYKSKAKVKVLYDKAYINRFGGLSAANTRIRNITSNTADKYINDFGILLEFTYSNYESYADKCPNYGNNYNGYCKCGGENVCTTPDNKGIYHHKNINQVMIHNKYEDTIKKIVDDYNENNQFITLIFTGHKLCNVKDSEIHRKGGLNGMAFEKESIALVASGDILVNNNNDKSLAFSQEVFDSVHEIGHVFRTNDNCTPPKGESKCIYSEERTRNYLYFCSKCKNIIELNRERFDY